VAARHPDPAIRQGARAVQLDLGTAADADAGRFDQAAASAARAEDQARGAGLAELAGDIAERVQRYRAHRPWRDTAQLPLGDERPDARPPQP
jgi:hypothetical protein